MLTVETFPDAVHRQTVLPNGIRVVSQYMPWLRSVTLGVWVWSGTRYEPENLNGIAHFLEHMVFKGTRRRTAYQIAQSVESLGGYLNALTGRELNCYYARVLDKHLPVAIDVLGDILQNSLFDEKEVLKEKDVVLDEIRGLEDDPEELVNDFFTDIVWKTHPLGRRILGREETVSRFTGDDLRVYLKDRYRAGNLYVIAAGHLDHDRLTDLVADHFQFPSGVMPAETVSPEADPTGERLVISRDSAQVQLCFGGLSIPFNDSRKYSLFILNTVLGGGMTSRLFQKIREEAGLAYSIYSDVEFCRDSGLFCVNAGTDVSDVARVIEMIQTECRTLRTQPVSPEELRDARSQLVGSLHLSLEGSSNVMNRLARLEIYQDEHVDVNDTVAAIEAVTEEDVLNLAEELLDERRLSLAVLGPVSDEDIP